MNLLRIAARVCAAAPAPRTAGSHLPNGDVIPVAPSSGSLQSPSTGLDVDYKLENVGHSGEKGYEDLRGSISIGGGPWFTMDATAYKSMGRYKTLTCSDPNVDPAAYNDQMIAQKGVDLAGLLAEAIDAEIMSYIEEHGIEYLENEGPFMDLSIDDNEATDRTDPDEEDGDQGQQRQA